MSAKFASETEETWRISVWRLSIYLNKPLKRTKLANYKTTIKNFSFDYFNSQMYLLRRKCIPVMASSSADSTISE